MYSLQKFSRLLAGVLAATAASPLIASGQDGQPPAKAALRSGTLSFTGHATVGDFVGATRVASGMVVRDLSSARGWVEAPVATLDTHNHRRDRDIRATLEAEKYPTMRFDLAGVTVESTAAGGDSAAVRLHGALTIHGVTRAVDLPATVSFVADSTHLTPAFPLDIALYRTGGLTRVFGLLRMQRQIDVRVDLWFGSVAREAQRAEREGR